MGRKLVKLTLPTTVKFPPINTLPVAASAVADVDIAVPIDIPLTNVDEKLLTFNGARISTARVPVASICILVVATGSSTPVLNMRGCA
jgi:hypothetical protein